MQHLFRGGMAHPLLMKHLSLCPLSSGSYTSTTSINFSSTCPSSASPAKDMQGQNVQSFQEGSLNLLWS